MMIPGQVFKVLLSLESQLDTLKFSSCVHSFIHSTNIHCLSAALF